MKRPPVPANLLPAVGEIYVANWGYDACISNFYKITKVTEKRVKAVLLGTERLPGGNAWVDYQVIPGEPIGGDSKEKSGTPYLSCNEVAIKIEGKYATKWSGKPLNNYNHH